MGHARPRPKHLAKLLQIRLSLGLSQVKFAKLVDEDHSTISKYEHDKNEPPLTVLLAYSRLAGIPLEQIIDDNIKVTF